jgi:hypothetical protein
MGKLAVLAIGAIAVVGIGIYLARRTAGVRVEHGTDAEPAPTPEPTPGPGPTAELPVDPDLAGTGPDPDAREAESEVTEETRFERLATQESDERHERARRLRDDPLTPRLGGDAETPH